MLVTEADVARLVALGHDAEDFVVVDDEGQYQLRNVPAAKGEDRSHCFFLRDGQCSVYADRPEGCRIYPFVLRADLTKVVRDVDCPWATEFPLAPGTGRRLDRVLRVIVREAKSRQG